MRLNSSLVFARRDERVFLLAETLNHRRRLLYRKAFSTGKVVGYPLCVKA